MKKSELFRWHKYEVLRGKSDDGEPLIALRIADDNDEGVAVRLTFDQAIDLANTLSAAAH